MDTESGMKMETYRIIASSGQVLFQGKQQDYVMLIGVSMNFHLHYLDALKKSDCDRRRDKPADCSDHSHRCPSGAPALRNVSNAIKTSPPRILMRGWNRHAFPLSWSNWLSRSII